MAVKIGSARIDEKGNINGGAAGDQTGNEIAEENFYMHSAGWYCYRPKTDAVANALATAMKQACANNNIGYDQSGRNGVITYLNQYKSLDKIAVKTEADCSSLVRACCIQAGFDPGNFTTYTEPAKLEATGKFQARFVVTDPSQLYTGDILVTRKKGHTAIVTSGKARGAATTTTSSSSNKPNKTAKFIGKVTAFRLNVRKGPGTAYANLVSYPVISNGTQVEVCDTVHTNYGKTGGTWYYIRINGDKGKKYGFVSTRYIKKV